MENLLSCQLFVRKKEYEKDVEKALTLHYVEGLSYLCSKGTVTIERCISMGKA